LNGVLHQGNSEQVDFHDALAGRLNIWCAGRTLPRAGGSLGTDTMARGDKQALFYPQKITIFFDLAQ
jgi:hypothetical protein